MRLSVVLPVYSETDSVREIIEKLKLLVSDELYEIIIIISPLSGKESLGVCDELKREYSFVKVFLQKDNPGVGRAFREGFEYASGTHILMMDSDGEMDAEAVPQMIAKIKQQKCSMVLASRWQKGGGAQGYKRSKYFLNRAYQYIFRILFLTRLHDLTFGFKIMDAGIAKGIAWASRYNDIGAETTLKPLKLGYKVEEVSTTWRRRKCGKSKARFLWNFRYVSTALSILLKFRG